MKILHFSALAGQTGAGVAAARIHAGLLERGIDSRFCVAYSAAGLQNAFTPGLSLAGKVSRRLQNLINGWLLAPHARGYDYVLSTGLVGHDIGRIVRAERPDLVHLHWIAGTSFRLATLAGVSLPIVWRLSDMWPFCSLAHLEPDRAQYTRSPPPTATLGLFVGDLPGRVMRAKQAIYRTLTDLTLVCPSRWLMAETQRSTLLGNRPIELIPTGCDACVFTTKDRTACRQALGFAVDSRIVLVGATSMGTRWKGFDLFVDAMVRFAGKRRCNNAGRVEIMTFGKDAFSASTLNGLNVTHLGPISDARLMAILYNAADVFVAASRMENLANTVLESLACGTPVVAFDIGGMPDMIDHEVNGFLAPPFETDKLADGIGWALKHRGDAGIRSAARNKILNEFSLEQEISKYIALYRKLLARPRGGANQEPAPVA